MTEQRSNVAGKSAGKSKTGGAVWAERRSTAVLVLGDGTVIEGAGLGPGLGTVTQ